MVRVIADLYLTMLAKFINSFSGAGSSLISELILSCIIMIIFAGVYAKVFSMCINARPALVLIMRGRAGASLDASDDDGRYMAGAALSTAQKGTTSLAEKFKGDTGSKGIGTTGNGGSSRQIAPSED